MPPGLATLDAAAVAELRSAAHLCAKHLPEGRALRLILREIGFHLEAGSNERQCRRCGHTFYYNREFYLMEGLSEPRRCFSCRIVTRGR